MKRMSLLPALALALSACQGYGPDLSPVAAIGAYILDRRQGSGFLVEPSSGLVIDND